MDKEVNWSPPDHEIEGVEDSLGGKKWLSHVLWGQVLQMYGQQPGFLRKWRQPWLKFLLQELFI